MRNVDAPTIGSPLPRKVAAHWVVLATSVLPAAFLMHMDRHVLVVLAPLVQREFHLDTVGITRILTATSWCYALFQLPGAWLANRIGPTATIALCVLAWSAAMLAMPLASTPATLLLLRALLGTFQAPDWLSSVMILEREVPTGQRSRATAALLFAAYLGAFLSGPACSAIAARFDWRAAFWIMGLIGLALAGVAFRASRVPEQTPRVANERQEAFGPGIWKALRRPHAHLLAVAYLLSIGVQSFVYILLPLYLVDARGTTLAQAGWISSAPYIALYLGVLGGGFVSDLVLRWTGSLLLARIPAIAAMAGSGVCFAMGMSSGGLASLTSSTCAGMFLAGVGQVIFWSLVQDLSERGDPFTTAWVQVCGALGLVLVSDLCSQIVEHTHGWNAIRPVFPTAGVLASLCIAGVLRPGASKAKQTAVPS